MAPIINTSRLIQFTEITTVISDSHVKQKYTLWTKCRVIILKRMWHTIITVLEKVSMSTKAHFVARPIHLISVVVILCIIRSSWHQWDVKMSVGLYWLRIEPDGGQSSWKPCENRGHVYPWGKFPKVRRTLCLSTQALSFAYNISAQTTWKIPVLCCMRICCRGNVFTNPFPSSGRIFLLIKNLLRRSGRRSVVCFFCLETNVVSEPFASNGCFYRFTILALSKYVTMLTTSLN
jgi:hypothetical protein